MLALNRDRVPAQVLDRATAWIDGELGNPYPDGPRFNTHATSDTELPELRNNLYTNAGHMWAFLARETLRGGRSPWAVPK